MLINVLGIAGTTTALLIALNIPLQVWTYHKEQRFGATTAISLSVVLNYIAWAWYGWMTGDLFLRIVHTIGSGLSVIIVAQFLWFQYFAPAAKRPEKYMKRFYLALLAGVIAVVMMVFTMSDVGRLFGTISTTTGLLVVAGFVWQGRKHYKEKRSGFIAPLIFSALVNYAVWAGYGYLKPDIYLQIVHTITFFVAAGLLYQCFHYGRASK